MTFSSYASHGPRNLYAAQRMGVTFVPEQRDVHAKRRLTNLLVAATLILVNVGLIAALAPSVLPALHPVDLSVMSAPQE